jgi:hypothetical protein
VSTGIASGSSSLLSVPRCLSPATVAAKLLLPIQMQSSGQYDNVESTALAKEEPADNSDVPKIQRESIRTRRERLHGMRVNIERTLAVGVSQELLNGFDIFSIRLQQRDEGMTGRTPADLLVNAICLRNRPDFRLHEIVRRLNRRPMRRYSDGASGEDPLPCGCLWAQVWRKLPPCSCLGPDARSNALRDASGSQD